MTQFQLGCKVADLNNFKDFCQTQFYLQSPKNLSPSPKNIYVGFSSFDEKQPFHKKCFWSLSHFSRLINKITTFSKQKLALQADALGNLRLVLIRKMKLLVLILIVQLITTSASDAINYVLSPELKMYKNLKLINFRIHSSLELCQPVEEWQTVFEYDNTNSSKFHSNRHIL